MRCTVMQSAESPHVYKLVYLAEGHFYYNVAYLNESASSGRKYVTMCVSTQIGCTQNCLFCATGSSRFICNLSAEQIYEELEDGLAVLDSVIREQRIDEVHVILEGMGEASRNFDACAAALDLVWKNHLFRFSKVVFRVSSVGRRRLLQAFEAWSSSHNYQNAVYQLKLSLHTAIPEERKYLFSDPELIDIESITNDYAALSTKLGGQLICNYILFEYPDGRQNYDRFHLDSLRSLLDRKPVILLLGRYSETGKHFRSPQDSVYEEACRFFEEAGITTFITNLKGADINAACGMLHYG